METACVRRVRAVFLAPLVIAAASAAVGPASAAEALPPPLLEATPLVLKDGRMAYVSVQAVPFEVGADALDPPVAEALGLLARGLATDCFLTAQAIGHVEPGAQGEGDTLAAHRLSRARAERVQRVLADHGLPANVVASVWDWQFMVREARATLWVFRMREGEDCKGTPLPAGKAAPLVAKAEPEATGRLPPTTDQPPAMDAEPVAAEGVNTGEPPAKPVVLKPSPDPRLRPSAVAAVPEESLPAAGPAEPDDPGPLPAAGPGTVADASPAHRPAVVAAAAAPATRAAAKADARRKPTADATADAEAEPTGPGTTRVVAAASPATRARPAARVELEEEAIGTAAAESSGSETAEADAGAVRPVRVAAIRPGSTGGAAEAGAGRLEIVFDNNSSYLPNGAARDLKRWLAALPPGKGYEVRLAAAVPGAGGKGSGADQAGRYERWLAERRLGRLNEWLEKNAQAIPELSVSRSYLERDASRRVVIEASPLP